MSVTPRNCMSERVECTGRERPFGTHALRLRFACELKTTFQLVGFEREAPLLKCRWKTAWWASVWFIWAVCRVVHSLGLGLGLG